MANRHSNLPEINTKLILQIWDWINFTAGSNDEPAWRQDEWSASAKVPEDLTNPRSTWKKRIDADKGMANEGYCGTACCIAGYALREHTNRKHQLIVGNLVERPGEDEEPYEIIARHDWVMAGAAALGLAPLEASRIFMAINNKEAIRRRFNDAFAARGLEVRL